MLMQISALGAVMRSSGAEYLGISKSGEIAVMKASDWSEDKHPRAANGQFGSGSGSSGKGKESQGAKRKRNQQARRAEAASQTTLGGGKAIQSLLSGGSALDKIGWLSTSKPKEPEKPAEKPAAKPSPETAMASLDDLNSLVTRTISEKGPLASFHEEANYVNYVLGAKTAQARNDSKRAVDELMRAKSKYGARHKTYRGMEKDPVYAEVAAREKKHWDEYKKLQQKQKEVDAAFLEHGIKLHASNPYDYGDVKVT